MEYQKYQILSGEFSRILQHACKDIDEAYICGGYLRNCVMGVEGCKDIDLFLKCTPNELKVVLDRMRQYGRIEYGQYKSPRLMLPQKGCYIDIVPFYNFVVARKPIESIEDLLTNFDITANAIGINIHTKQFFNPMNGLEDIKKHILRAVRLDFPDLMVSKDIQLSTVSVFLFRLLHYQHKLGFSLDSRTREWILQNKKRWGDIEMMKRYFFEPELSDDIKKQLMT